MFCSATLKPVSAKPKMFTSTPKPLIAIALAAALAGGGLAHAESFLEKSLLEDKRANSPLAKSTAHAEKRDVAVLGLGPETVEYILLPLSAPRSDASSRPPLGLDQLLASATDRTAPQLSLMHEATLSTQANGVVWRPQPDRQVVAAQVLGLASNADMQGLGLCASEQGLSPLLNAASCSALSFAGSEPLVLKLSGIGMQLESRVTENTDISMSGSIVRQRPVTFSQDFIAFPISAEARSGARPLLEADISEQLAANLGGRYWLNPNTSVGLTWAYREQTGSPLLAGFRERSINLGFTREQFTGTLVGRVIESDGPSQRYGSAQRLSGSTIDMGLILRLPWRAALSVGAKNLLKSSNVQTKKIPTGIAVDDDLLDRMAYIRYEQDL